MKIISLINKRLKVTVPLNTSIRMKRSSSLIYMIKYRYWKLWNIATEDMHKIRCKITYDVLGHTSIARKPNFTEWHTVFFELLVIHKIRITYQVRLIPYYNTVALTLTRFLFLVYICYTDKTIIRKETRFALIRDYLLRIVVT